MTQPSALATAMAELQQSLPTIAKTSEVEIARGVKTRYADLATVSDAILPQLGKLGLSFISYPTFIDGRFVLACELLHTSGESRTGQYPITGNNAHQIGSAITYGRRYMLGAMTGLTPEDDDGGAASLAASSPRTAQRQQTKQEKPEPSAPSRPQPALPTDDGKMTRPQQGKMHALFTDLSVTDREERLNYVMGVISRPIESSSELTKDEAGKVIDSLERWLRQAEPAQVGA